MNKEVSVDIFDIEKSERACNENKKAGSTCVESHEVAYVQKVRKEKRKIAVIVVGITGKNIKGNNRQLHNKKKQEKAVFPDIKSGQRKIEHQNYNYYKKAWNNKSKVPHTISTIFLFCATIYISIVTYSFCLIN
jgi:hypothetical protein